MVRSPPCRFCRESLLQAGRDPRLSGQQGVLRSSCLSKQISWLGMLAGPQLSPPEWRGKPAGWSHTGGGTAAVILRKLEWS